jgi:type II secretory pathway pseudopilin PulG
MSRATTQTLLGRLRGRLRQEAGFTLIEVMMVAAGLTVVLGAVAMFGDTAQTVAARDQERTHSIREAQAGIYRMTRELRHAHQVHTASPLVVEFNAVSGGADTRVRFDCSVAHPTDASYRRCLRYVVSGGVPGSGEVIVDRTLNTTSAFTYTTNVDGRITYIQAKLDVRARGERKSGFGYGHRISLHDGTYLRNLDGGY